MTDMKALVKRLDKWLKKNRPDYYAILYPGLKTKEIKDFEDWLGFRLPQAWKDLYTWRNGQHDPNSLDANGQGVRSLICPDYATSFTTGGRN